MSDDTEDNVVPFGKKDEMATPNEYVINLLESLLDRAKEGDVQEVFTLAYSPKEGFILNIIADFHKYDPAISGYLNDIGLRYREICQAYEEDV